ncbi:MAG TPA: mandelate racemase/muconate lactonizing enzyme family protein [Caldilineaceae bacterium]|nr:mandelate racemase/muconate lactonizing enzyme family protein [Caldilineaceae bacterium]
MKIEAVDLFYLSMPEVLDIGDGSQDALLVRVAAGGYEGWGECEASPLTSIAAFVAPMSHSACKPVAASVLGQPLNDVADIYRIGDLVRADSQDILQTDHTLSGIDMALWDLLGKKQSEPVWKLLGYDRAYPKLPYASMLFGDTPQATLEKGKAARAQGYRAAKFGWGPIGLGSAQQDADHFVAAREGLGDDGILLIDIGTVWRDDVEKAAQRLPALQACRATWLEEPFVSGALQAYHALAGQSGTVKLAGGEGSHNDYMAQQMIDYAGIGYVQIDAGRIGGLSVAKAVADYAHARGVTYVNHTFTSHLALSASLQPFAGLQADEICEYPVELKPLAVAITENHLERDAEGYVHAPAAPGLGMTVNREGLQEYLVETEIRVKGEVLYRTPIL